MVKYFVLFFVVVSLFSCTNSKDANLENQKTDQLVGQNDLLPKKVIVYNEVNFKQQSIPNWTEGVDFVFMDKLNNRVLESDASYFFSNIYYYPNDKIETTKEEVHKNMYDGGIISSLYFVESWSFDKQNYRFKKNIETWSPVFQYYKKDGDKIDSTILVKKLLYDVWGDANSRERQIAKNITYEVNLSSENKTNEYLNVEDFANMIIEPVISGEIKSYDFFDENELDPMAVKRFFGYSVDTVETENPISGEIEQEIYKMEASFSGVEAFVFVEDWYIDTFSYQIRKQVKSIAPVFVETEIDEDGEAYEIKKIAFKVNL